MARPLGESFISAALAILAGVSGCTSHPPGEAAERQHSLEEARSFQTPSAKREAPPLLENPSPDELVRYALLTNPELEQHYWEWRSAIEQIPQDGTQPTNLVFFAGVPITRGSTSFDRTTVTVANDPMADILWPTKPSTAARRALENARAAGLRFQKAKYELRSKVLNAYYDLALASELIRLEEANRGLLQTTASLAEARNRVGAAGQQDLMKAQNEADLAQNDVTHMQAQLVAQRAALNALLNRRSDAPLPSPAALPEARNLAYTDGQILDLASVQNPELKALAHEVNGRHEGIRLARLQYLPDFSLSAGSDLAGTAQSLTGMLTVPLLRHEAIQAAIAQAQANLRMTESLRRQTHNDLESRIVLDLVTLRDADRQLELFQKMVLPRATRVVEIGRSAYESGHASLSDLLDSQRTLISLQKLIANLRAEHGKRFVDVESLVSSDLSGRGG